MKLYRLFPALIYLILTSSCATLHRQSSFRSSIFTPEETKLITASDSLTPMRILLITNKKDSIVLRQKSKAFKVDAGDAVLRHFTKRLYATVTDSSAQGVGIAAPQVGVLKRIIWVQRLDKKGQPFEVYYNPVIRKYSLKKQDVPEGCLSIPDRRGVTTDRAYAILLEYDDTRGTHKCEMVEAFTAAIFQHEIDHLNGILFIDHLLKEEKEGNNHHIGD